jgi:hypothetical protein
VRDEAVKAVDRIVEDLRDRRGLKWEWNKIDETVQAEIREAWALIVGKAVSRAVAAEREACALAAEDCYHGPGDHGCSHGREIAAAIRARGEP